MNENNKIWNFPAGEVGIEYFKEDTSKYHLKLENGTSDQIVKVLLQANAIRHQDPSAEIHLLSPYVPYGRQDRVSAPGTSFSLEVFAQIIGTGNFSSITIVDPHSLVTIYELKKYISDICAYHASDFMDPAILDSIERYSDYGKADIVVLAPDKGAVLRAEECADVLGINEVHFAEKVRDPATGEIKGIVAPTIKNNHHVLVIDDICDGGRTFIELAKAIDHCASKTLFVTHGIFSKGVDIVLEHYNSIWTTDSFKQGSRVKVIPLNKHFNW